MVEAVAVTVADAIAEESGIVSAEAQCVGGSAWAVFVERDADGWTDEQFRRLAMVFGVQVMPADYPGKVVLV
jgi:hypothetical protein